MNRSEKNAFMLRSAPDSFRGVSFDRSSVKSLETFIRMVASVEPEDVVTSLRGSLTALVPNTMAEMLLRVEGFSVSRTVRTSSGFRVLSREALLFFDAQGEAPLTTFAHSMLDRAVDVGHVWVDPTQETFSADEFLLRPHINDSLVAFRRDILRQEANPLEPNRWPKESSGDRLFPVDLRNYVATRHDVDSTAPSVACETTRTWITPWLPWMLLGTTPGHLVWHLGGTKLRGYGALSKEVRAFVDVTRPEFAFAPRNPGDNETLWSQYAKEQRPIL